MLTVAPSRPVNRAKLSATIELLRELVCELEHPERGREFFGELVIRVPFQGGIVQDGVTAKVEETVRPPRTAVAATLPLRKAG
jgi:hypothetical protein